MKNIQILGFCIILTLFLSNCNNSSESCPYYPVSRMSFILHYNDGAISSQLFSASNGVGSQPGYHVDSVRLTGNSGQVLPMDAEYDAQRGEWLFSTEKYTQEDGEFGGSEDGLRTQRLILKLKYDRQDTLEFTYEKRKEKRSDSNCPATEFGSANYFFNQQMISDQVTFYPFLELEILE